jgi:ADP-heptose:LPS heptosyltransferase
MQRTLLHLLLYFRSLTLTFFDWIAVRLPHAHGEKKESRVLLVKLDAIGDFILYLDAAKGIRELFPDKRITLIGNQVWTSLAEGVGLFDKVWPVDRHKFLWSLPYRRKILRNVAEGHFDIAIHPTFSREYLYGDAVVRASRARERIGSIGDCSNILPGERQISNRWYTRLVPASDGPLMELQRNAEFLRQVGLPAFRSSIPDLSGFPLPPLADRLSDYYVIFPGAGAPIKQWPVKRFAALTERIHHATGWTGIVCGGPGEEGIGDILVGNSDAPLESRSGRTSLPELVSIIAGARLVVANDTSAIHIAAAVSTPAVCILGGGHYGRFLPYSVETPTTRPLPVAVTHAMDCYQCNWRCIYEVKKNEPAPCVGNISIDSVWHAGRQILPRTSMTISERDRRSTE